MYNDEQFILDIVKNTLFMLLMLSLGAFFEWEVVILVILTLIYLKRG
jgi:hypothetical protein